MKDVAMVIHEGVQALDVAGPLDVLAEATALLPPGRGYRSHLVARTTRPIAASNGMLLTAHLTFAQADRPFHTVLVAGGTALPTRPPDKPMTAWLRSRSRDAERYGSVCTGAFALGHAGLLDGRIATTHWQNAADLAARFPAARIEPDRIHARDGALVTSAGVTAGIDLALALVAEDHGASTALATAKRLVVVRQRQGGQSQFSPLLQPVRDAAGPLAKVQAYVADHLREPFPAARLAAIAGTSVRTLSRLFERELATTPHDFVESLRLDQARNRLEATTMPAKSVAFECGFASPGQMRDIFQRRLGVGPLRYRQTFAAGSPTHSSDLPFPDAPRKSPNCR